MSIVAALSALMMLAPQETVSLDLLDQPCVSFAGADPIAVKPAQLIAIGYVRGYVDARYTDCARLDRSGAFCQRLRAMLVSGDVFAPTAVAEAVSTYCTRHSGVSIRQALHQFMAEKGVVDPTPVVRR